MAGFALREKVPLALEQPSDESVLTMDSQSCEACGRNARLAATSSKFSISLFSRSDLRTDVVVQGHEKKITGVKFSLGNPNLLYSSSHDKTVKGWDFRADIKKPIQIFSGHEDTNTQLSCLDLTCDDRILCAGTETDKDGDSYLIFWDSRKSAAMGVYEESHENDITQVKFHPEKRDVLASGSTDALVCLFDISKSSEDDALYGTLNTGSSVAEVGWCGNQFQNIYCTTHVDTLQVWDSEEFDCLDNFPELRDDLQAALVSDSDVDYVVDCFQPKKTNRMHVVAGSHEGQMYLFELHDHCLTHISTLDAGHRDDARCVSWDDQSESLVTGGDDAMLCLWERRTTRSSGKHTGKAPSKFKRKSRPSAEYSRK